MAIQSSNQSPTSRVIAGIGKAKTLPLMNADTTDQKSKILNR
jgi:hypothetical protein